MQFIFRLMLVLAGLVLLPYQAWSAQTINGNLNGTFTGSATDDSGSYSGNVEGSWSATGTFNAGSNFVESVTGSSTFVESVTGSGTFGGAGIAGSWRVTGYNATTKTISVTWAAPGNRGPSGGSADGSVALVLNTATGIATGAFQGQFFTPNGVKSISGTWTVQFQGYANRIVTGKIQSSVSGSASQVGNFSGAITGDWLARFMPDGSVAGTASGSYNGGNVGVGFGSVCICGTWISTLVRGTDGKYRFDGSWTHQDVPPNLSGSGGGPMALYINTDVTPIQASGDFSGAVTYSTPFGPVMGFTSGKW